MIDSERLIEALNNIAGQLKPMIPVSNEVPDGQVEDLPNPLQLELNAVRDELCRTHQQLNKITELAELFSRQLVKLSKSSILKSMSK